MLRLALQTQVFVQQVCEGWQLQLAPKHGLTGMKSQNSVIKKPTEETGDAEGRRSFKLQTSNLF